MSCLRWFVLWYLSKVIKVILLVDPDIFLVVSQTLGLVLDVAYVGTLTVVEGPLEQLRTKRNP